MPSTSNALPPVAPWRVIALRVIYLLIALGLSRFVWEQLLFEAADMAAMTGVAKSMMAALVILCLFGLRYPLDLLPVLIFELAWKALWMLFFALPAALYDRWTASIENLFYECVGVVILLALIPWNYVWARWVTRSSEPWLPNKTDPA